MEAPAGSEIVSPRLVTIVAVVLVGLALFGGYQGWKRSLTDPDVAAEVGGLGAAAPGAKAASPLAEANSATLTESQIREIARQEARGVLNRPATTSAPAAGTDTEAKLVPATPSLRPAAPMVVPPAPPLQTPTPPPPPADNAPLF